MQELSPEAIQGEDQRNTHRGIFIILGIIAFFCVGLGGVLLGKFLYAPKALPVATSVTPMPRTEESTETPTQDATVDWETYTNASHGFSLKYPKTWRFQATSEGCGPVFFYPNSTEIWLTVCGPYIGHDDTPEEMANRSTNSSSVKLEAREQIVIDNHRGIRQVIRIGDIQRTIEIYVGGVTTMMKYANGQPSRDIGTLALYYYIQDLDKLAEAKSSFDQILSTFKFID